jgi:GNAT superfamily N-acetyltransferase
MMDCRDASAGDVEALAQLWHVGWQDAHAQILPEAVRNARTLESFRERLSANLASVRVIDDALGAAGFAFLKDDELYQFYVHARARGTGCAQRLIEDAQAQFAERGVKTAWLACAIGNDRAARFYEKGGWRRQGVEQIVLDLPAGAFPLDIWRYERSVGSDRKA